jgi:hypothetical protein
MITSSERFVFDQSQCRSFAGVTGANSRNWVRLHITGMGSSYVLLIVAFYVDNGRNLPIWKYLPPVVYWLLPSAIGGVLIARALLRHPLARRQ